MGKCSTNGMHSVPITDAANELLPTNVPRLEPSAEVKNIMVTGGNGFVYVPLWFHLCVPVVSTLTD